MRAGRRPLVWYEGSGTSIRRWLHGDERGSVIAVSDNSANLVGSTPNRYDEYGNLQGTLTGRFGYTGQAWLPEVGVYDYRARFYHPGLGRFMQTDPIGYNGGMNLYAYVRDDPVNSNDPSGLQCIRRNFVVFRYEVASGRVTEILDRFSVLEGDCSRSEVPTGNRDQLSSSSAASGCTESAATRRAIANALASRLGPVTFDTPTEMRLLEQYFRGSTTPYVLSDSEFAAARAFVERYPGAVGRNVIGRSGEYTIRSIYFASYGIADRNFDGLFGSAWGIFRGNHLVGIRDHFNFDFKDRGGFPMGWIANLGVAVIRFDAATCSGNVSIPVSGGAVR